MKEPKLFSPRTSTVKLCCSPSSWGRLRKQSFHCLNLHYAPTCVRHYWGVWLILMAKYMKGDTKGNMIRWIVFTKLPTRYYYPFRLALLNLNFTIKRKINYWTYSSLTLGGPSTPCFLSACHPGSQWPAPSFFPYLKWSPPPPTPLCNQVFRSLLACLGRPRNTSPCNDRH
jgi:hypothetical protein